MQARLIKDKAGEFYILCSDGSIIDADFNNLYYLLTEFSKLGSLGQFKNSKQKWNDNCLDMALYPGENYAYVTDNYQLVIIDFLPFHKILDNFDSPGKMISTVEYGELHGKSPEQIKVLCRAGRIKGARKVGTSWLVPENAPYPANDRGRRSKK